MAVQANLQQIQLKAISTSNTVVTSNPIPTTVQALPSNGLIHAVFPSASAKDPSKQVQLRVVPATQTSNSNKLNQMQPPVVRLIKASNKIPITNANIISVKPAISSPAKGVQPTLILQNNPRKLKVGDTITIPKTTCVHSDRIGHPSSGIHKTGILSTPPKIIRVSESAIAQTPVFINRATPLHSPVTLVQASTTLDSSTSLPQQVISPSRIDTVSPAWSPSPLRYKRPSAFSDATQASETKRRRTPNSEKGSKGLRHFAMLVCEKVKQKGTTTYNEVADELVAEYSDSHPNMSEQQYDQKNIRRRVYDALNVLMAMNIIYKDKKDINWIGFPTNSAQELISLQDEKKKRAQRIEQKSVQLQELILQQIAFMNLVQRNKRIQETQGLPPENSFIQLPFIIVNTSKKTVIDCSISNDKYEYMFNFDNTFEIHDDIEVLKRMGMAYGLESGRCNPDNLRTAQSLLPPALKPYLEEMAGCLRVSTSANSDAVSNFTLPSSIHQQSNQKSTLNKTSNDPESLELGSCFSMEQVLDPDDQEVAMVTDNRRLSASSGVLAAGVAPSSRSSSSGLHSAIYSITPMSSAGSESRGSTPFESFES